MLMQQQIKKNSSVAMLLELPPPPPSKYVNANERRKNSVTSKPKVPNTIEAKNVMSAD